MGFSLREFRARFVCAVACCSSLMLGAIGCGGGGSSRVALDIVDPAPPSFGAAPASAAPQTRPKMMVASQTSSTPKRLVTPVAQSRQAARDLRVMSFNVRLAIFIDAHNFWDFRKGLVVETIRNFNPDLLGTQESLAGQSDYLRGQLSEYDFVGAGRNDGHRRGEMCGVYFKRARFEKLASGHFWLSETPSVPGSKSWGTSFPRMVTWVKLRDRADGNALCWFNTHFDHRGQRARAESAKLLRRRIDAIARDLPVVVTGDFNATEDTAPYRTLITGTRPGDARFVDTFRAVNRTPVANDGTRHDFWGGKGGPRIDWIVTSNAFQTVAAAIDHTRAGARYPSDHFPVTAVLRPAAPVGVARVE